MSHERTEFSQHRRIHVTDVLDAMFTSEPESVHQSSPAVQRTIALQQTCDHNQPARTLCAVATRFVNTPCLGWHSPDVVTTRTVVLGNGVQIDISRRPPLRLDYKRLVMQSARSGLRLDRAVFICKFAQTYRHLIQESSAQVAQIAAQIAWH